MNNNAELIERFYAVRRGDFGFLESINLVRNVDQSKWNGFELTIVLRSEPESSSPSLRVMFAGVQDIRIGELSGLLCYMLEIRSIEEMQLEGRRFRVTESEYDAIAFECEAFDFM